MGEFFIEPINGTTTTSKDNQSTIAYSHNALLSETTKHIGMKWYENKMGYNNTSKHDRLLSNGHYLLSQFGQICNLKLFTTMLELTGGGLGPLWCAYHKTHWAWARP
jgi:hypothetical protein